MAGEAILVLFAQDKLGLGSAGCGLLLAGFGVGGVLGRTLGVRAPFLLGAAVLGAAGLLALPAVNDRTVQTARIAAAEASSTSNP